MEISIVAVGRLKAGPERDLCERYLDRARKTGKSLGFKGFAVREIPEARAARPADRIAHEAAAVAALLPARAKTICLDERGEVIDSSAFGRELRRLADSGVADLAVVIGGPDGLGEPVKAEAQKVISLGRMTWPHQIVRILVAEQLYRAMTVLSGHPYHRA